MIDRDLTRNGRMFQVDTLASSALAIAKQMGDEQFNTALKALVIPQKDLHHMVQKDWDKLKAHLPLQQNFRLFQAKHLPRKNQECHSPITNRE